MYNLIFYRLQKQTKNPALQTPFIIIIIISFGVNTRRKKRLLMEGWMRESLSLGDEESWNNFYLLIMEWMFIVLLFVHEGIFSLFSALRQFLLLNCFVPLSCVVIHSHEAFSFNKYNGVFTSLYFESFRRYRVDGSRLPERWKCLHPGESKFRVFMM